MSESNLVIATAAAGAGKTYTLASRFLDHLAKAGKEYRSAACVSSPAGQACTWSEILAITFTNKAAAEMQQRVLKSLKQRALGQDADGLGKDITQKDAARWVQVILKRMGSLNIRTIDSLLHQVLRLGALELGLPPDVQLEFSSEKLFDLLYDDCIALADQGDETWQELLHQALDAEFRLHRCSRFLPVNTFRENLLAVFNYLLSLPPGEFESLLVDPEQLQQALVREYNGFIQAVRDMRETLEKDKLAGNKYFLDYLAKALACNLYDEPPDSKLAAKPGLQDCLLKKSHGQITNEAEKAYTRLKHRHQRFAMQAGPLKKAQSMAHMASLCRHLLERMELLLPMEGLAPAARLPYLAQALLSDQACCNEALCRMGNRLTHLLIDEFQDTSLAQWAALEPLAVEALAKGGSLFYVGDVKQAIYRWRGGEASLFADVPEQQEIKNVLLAAPKKDKLPCNWRSCWDVVDFNSEFFSQLGDVAKAGAVAAAMLPKAPPKQQQALAQRLQDVYKDATQEVAEKNKDKRGFVHIEPLYVHGDKEEIFARVHERLRALLLEEIGLSTPQPKASPKDVAILVRKNDEAAQVAKWCLEWGVSVVTENSLMLREHPLVQQMTALMAFLDYPRDDLAFWDAISGEHLLPASCEISARELHDWLTRSEGGPLYTRFRRDFPKVWREFIEPLFQQAGFMSAYDVLCDIIARFRLLQRHPSEELYLRRLLETAYAAEAQGALSLAAFLELWKERGDEQKVPLPENLDAVQIVTIHKSKGLEFPIVIMPFHHGDSAPGENQLRMEITRWNRDSLPQEVLARLHKNLEDDYYREALPQLLEQLNLLYVGWTRARQGLYALLTCNKRYLGSSPLLRALEILLQKFNLPLVTSDDEEETEGQQQEEARFYFSGVPLEQLDLAPASRTGAPSSQPSRATPMPLEEVGDMPMDWLPRLNIYRSELDEANFEARKRGTLAHRCLEHLQVGHDPEQDVGRALRAGLRGYGDPHDPAAFAEDNKELEAELADMLAWARSQPELIPLLKRGRGEQELLLPDGAVKRVDFLAFDEHGPVAVEYKTGGPSPKHQTQLGNYLQLLNELPATAGQRARGLLVYLDERRVQPVEG